MGANSRGIATMGDYVYTGYPLADIDVNVLAKYARQSSEGARGGHLPQRRERRLWRAHLQGRVREARRQGRRLRELRAERDRLHGRGTQVARRQPRPRHLHGNAGDSPQAIQQMRQLGIKVPITSYARLQPGPGEADRDASRRADRVLVAPARGTRRRSRPSFEKFKAPRGAIQQLPAVQYVHDTPTSSRR